METSMQKVSALRAKRGFWVLATAALLLQVGSSSCTCLTCGDEMDEPDKAKLVWPDSIATTQQRIIGLHATADELHVFTANEFRRYSKDFALVESRNVVSDYQNLGQPAANDLVHARVLRDLGTLEEVLQISLAQNAAASETIVLDSLGPEPINVLATGETVGAFNNLGTVYVQPVLRRDTRQVALMLFSISTNQTFTRITDLKFERMVTMPEVREIERAVSSINYFSGHFYIATKFGGYRLSEAGVLERLTPTNTEVRDFFRYDGDFYATQSSAGPMLTSVDGRNWASSGIATDLRLVSVFGDSSIVSHELEGWAWRISKAIEKQSKPIQYNKDIVLNDSFFFGMVRFNRRFYMSVDKTILASDELKQIE